MIAVSVYILSGAASGVGEDNSLEYQIKAAFLYNFAKFVEWPNSGTNSADTFIVGVLGPDPFGGLLERTLQGKSLAGKTVVVKHYNRPEQARECKVLFVGISDRASLPQVLSALAPGVLTVGQERAFLNAGGMISFFLVDRKVRFEVNREPAQKAGLHISAQLLKLSRAVWE